MEKRILAKMGYAFNQDDLTQFDVDCFTWIAQTWNEQEQAEFKKKNKRGK